MFIEFFDSEKWEYVAIRKSEIIRVELRDDPKIEIIGRFSIWIYWRRYTENIRCFRTVFRTNDKKEALSKYRDILAQISDESTTKKNSPEIEDLLCKNIKHLKLSYRPYHCLKRIGIATIRDLIKYIDKKPSRLYDRIDNFGRKSSYETIQALESKGLSIYTEV